eukprot:gnl/TRDRNA2_/TRDRNA2_176951_c0_seq3.p1 gnl/TRDRNA2_/TRDRNA2_176951_c0~~gnl/TRDRNA2_/TRDRNA2_176951_c0_seq3.p1  ORF type:complete len:167 (-),score=31.03 gnl/TRDRNA2_/TRDRNA2_176951_c0_seq3:214-714(-)
MMYENTPFLDAIAKASLKRLHEFHAQDSANMARSLWVLTYTDIFRAWAEPGSLVADDSSGTGGASSLSIGNKDPVDSAKGQRWLSLKRSVHNLSLEAWLRLVDEQGRLLRYLDNLKRDFDSAEQVILVYAKACPDGSTTCEPAFFTDMAVENLGHRRLFLQWFESY